MKTKFNWICDDWRRVKNHCRTTDNKDFTEKDATDKFKKQLLISEHSPIRLLEFEWSWWQIPYWLHAEWARHKFEKFVSSSRDDRLKDDIPRAEKPQGALVNFDAYANMQNLIDAWRKRLCYQATKEARNLAYDFKARLDITHHNEANVLVPHCVYRGGCPEFKTCGLWDRFIDFCMDYYIENRVINQDDMCFDAYGETLKMMQNIQERYDMFTKFCEEKLYKENDVDKEN